MDTVRKPILILAIALAALMVLLELGALGLLGKVEVSDATIESIVREEMSFDISDLSSLSINDLIDQAKEKLAAYGRRPSLGISYLALLDGQLLFMVALTATSLLIPQRVRGRRQGIATLVFSILLGLLAILLIVVAIGLLSLMLSLLGTVVMVPVYIGQFGFFDRTGATIILGLLLLLKLGFVGSIIAANKQFLQNKGLLFITLAALLSNIVILVLYNVVPWLLVSVIDAIAAIIIAGFSLVWAIVLLIGGLGSVRRREVSNATTISG
jgi:hypothetical protein